MSEKNDGKPPADDPSGAETSTGQRPPESSEEGADVPVPPPAPEPREEAATAPRGIAGALALVLVILLLVLGAGAAYWFQERLRDLEAGQQGVVTEQALSTRSEALEQRIAELGGRVSNLSERLDSRLQGIAELRARVQGEADARRALADRVDQLFRRMESSRSDWRHAEAAYLAGIADYRARLLGDVDGALEALEAADQLLAGLGGAGVDARQAVAAAIDQLLAAEEPDLGGISDGISEVSQRLAELPLAADVDRFAPEAGDGEGAADDAAAATADDGWRARLERAWAELREGLSGLVTISRDRRVEPLPSPETRFLLEQNLSLQLESARLAALRGNAEPYRASLERVDDWVGAYFDTADPAVSAVRERLASLQEATVTAQIPDIRDTLAPVRNWE